MSLIKRIRNLWEISKFSQEDYVGYVKRIVIPTEKSGYINNKHWSDVVLENPRPMATIIKLTPKDDIDTALKVINPETNG